MAYDIPVLYKQPSEGYLYDMDFTGRLRSGDTLVSVTSVTFSPDDLDGDDFSITGAVASGRRVQFTATGGIAGTKYKITVKAVTAGGLNREGEGYLFIRDV